MSIAGYVNYGLFKAQAHPYVTISIVGGTILLLIILARK